MLQRAERHGAARIGGKARGTAAAKVPAGRVGLGCVHTRMALSTQMRFSECYYLEIIWGSTDGWGGWHAESAVTLEF